MFGAPRLRSLPRGATFRSQSFTLEHEESLASVLQALRAIEAKKGGSPYPIPDGYWSWESTLAYLTHATQKANELLGQTPGGRDVTPLEIYQVAGGWAQPTATGLTFLQLAAQDAASPIPGVSTSMGNVIPTSRTSTLPPAPASATAQTKAAIHELDKTWPHVFAEVVRGDGSEASRAQFLQHLAKRLELAGALPDKAGGSTGVRWQYVAGSAVVLAALVYYWKA